MAYRKTSIESPAMKRIVSVLEKQGPLSMAEISEEAFVSHNTLRSGGYLQMLCEAGRIHIKKWVRNTNGSPSAIYAHGPDKRKCGASYPTKYSNAEKSKRWKDKTGYNEARKKARAMALLGSMAVSAGVNPAFVR